MSPGTKLGDHIDEFNKFILDLANIDIEIEDEDRALMLLTSLPLSYEKFVETLLFRIGKNYLTMEFSSGDSKFKGFKSRGGTGKLSASYVIQRVSSEREIVQEREALAVVRNDETTELVMDSGGPYHMTHMREFLYDFKVFDCGSVRFGDNRTCTIKGTGKVKIQLHDGSSFILEDVSHKQVGFNQLGLGVETGVHGVQVSNDDVVVAQRWLEDKQLEENTNTDSKLVKGARKRLTLVERCGQTFLTVTGVTGNLREEGIVAEKKKVEDSKKANTRDNTEVHLSGHRRKLNLICNAVADKVQVVWRKVKSNKCIAMLNSLNLIASQKEKMVAEIIRRESRKLLTSMGSSVLIDDAIRDESESKSSSGSEDPNSEGFTEEETKALRAMISKQVGKAIKNVMPYYIRQTTNNLKEVIRKELEELKKGGMMNDSRFQIMAFLRVRVLFALVVVRRRTKLTSPQTSVVIVLKCSGKEKFIKRYRGNEKLKDEKFQRMLRDDIREVISPFKCTTLEDLLSRARLREADLLRKKNKETKRKLDFVDRDAKKPKL
ncbi:hypothetical protein Tco_0320422 [Tanacetum coccineum]